MNSNAILFMISGSLILLSNFIGMDSTRNRKLTKLLILNVGVGLVLIAYGIWSLLPK